MSESGLILRGVSISVNRQCLLRNLDLQVAPGEVVSLMGPSGCGKSSLLGLIGGTLHEPFAWEGEIWIDQRRIDGEAPWQRGVGFLFQDDLLFPHMSVSENLIFAMPRSFRGRRPRLERARAALASIGLKGFANRMPKSLSGGQRSRVGLLRALLAEPRALLLDEPFSALDHELRREVRRLVLTQARAAGLPTLLATHDPADARAAGGITLQPWFAPSAEVGRKPA